ncbi:Sterol O-acyltransferase 2 (Sterol-ester synthase 2) [Fusarium torreyae]|uniref:O-acyltransferase n=1 Tax=Fusarium torreyae TaxID=1237075 RepID=A0A9W8VHF3_9HYPO|nr:Sterol O-acyltransferase 2 (Sterol-ester synthase 2) [Fusarium torreyae]
MSSSIDALPNGNGHAGDHDHVLRPRPRKPKHSQVSEVLRMSTASDGEGHLMPDTASTGTASGLTSGRSTPVPENAPPSVKVLSTVRKQARAEQRRRIFPTIEFASRVSHFDPESDYRDFHGFFNLFWIGLAIMGITSMLRNLKDTGFPLRVQIWSLFAVKLWHLAIADFLMVATTAVSLPLNRAARNAKPGSFLVWHRGGRAIQSIYQVAWLSLWIVVPFYFEWTWTSQVFFLLHTMVLLMKMHSYAFYNGHLSQTEKRLHALDNPFSPPDRRPAYQYPTADHPGIIADTNGESANTNGKKRRRQRSRRRRQQPKRTGSDGNKSNDEVDATNTNQLAPSPSASATNSADEVDELREDLACELTSPMGNVTYPNNLTWSNYLDYLLCPTLCYEIEYPRTASINWISLIAKIIATFGCIFLLTIISEDFILPVLTDASERLDAVPAVSSLSEKSLILAETISWLLFPFMLTFLLVFLVIFEYVLGAFAEITCFADRHFYSDWWNSTDWMEFSREWNIPVYSFLRRHVYSASRARIGRGAATALTFLISAFGHEIVMACITKKLRGYGFVCQMLQLPIVMLQRTRWVRGKKTLNNVCFWASMVLGLSMICALYVLV